ncbi:MAG: lipocalin family protein [Candidatus Marinimicrobia bacterium]|nr:lipocalin family protein [Candidatus Neomarinimicrobiota bacterium]
MNQSKKLFNVMAMLTVAAMFTMVGCDDNGDDPDPQDALVGSWKMTNMIIYYGSSVASADSSDDLTAFVGNSVFTFNSDGTGKDVTVRENSTETNTWTYSATATEITKTAGGETEVRSYAISGNTLTFTLYEAADPDFDMPELWWVFTFTKQ